jgi:hypothetical protein
MRILINRSISLAFIAMAISRGVSSRSASKRPQIRPPRRPYQAGGTADITRFFREKREGNKASNDGKSEFLRLCGLCDRHHRSVESAEQAGAAGRLIM